MLAVDLMRQKESTKHTTVTARTFTIKIAFFASDGKYKFVPFWEVVLEALHRP